MRKGRHFQPTARTRYCATGARSRGAFSLLDVLVSLAVIMVLLGLLMPTLTHVREIARRVVCSSNMRQISQLIIIFAGDHDDNIPDSLYLARQNYQPAEMITLYTQVKNVNEARWDGIGLLYGENYVSTPGIFYCPSHTGNHALENYRDSWQNPGLGNIKGNFHYRGRGENKTNVLAEFHPASAALVADAMRTKADFNHIIGTNVMRTDGSVFWYHDSELSITGRFPVEINSVATSNALKQIWRDLDKGPR